MWPKTLALAGAALTGALAAFPASASLVGTLREVLLAEGADTVGVEATAAALSATIPQNFPLPAASTGFVYEFNPAVGIFERLTTSLGPIFAERPQTLGRGGFNTALSYTFVDFDSIDGRDLGSLRSAGLAVVVLDRMIDPDTQLGIVPIVDTRVDLGVEAHIFTPSFTYGATSDLDLNIAIPLVRTSVDVDADYRQVAELPVRRLPDGRVINVGPPTFLPDMPLLDVGSGSDDALGVGDLALRAKYRFLKTDLLDVAGGLVLRLPTGDEDDLQGTGDTELGTFLYAAKTYGQRIEPHLNLGVEFVTDDVDRSRFRYAAGASVIVADRLGPLTDLNLVIDFVGRNEFQKRVDAPLLVQIDREAPVVGEALNLTTLPYLIEVERNDIADFSVGIKVGVGRTGVVFLNALVPMNDDGFRADFVPSGGVEYTF